MKQLLNRLVAALSIICLMLLVPACENQDEEMLADESLTFSVNLDQLNAINGRVEDLEAEAVAAVIVTVKRMDNSIVYASKKLAVYAFGGKFVSDPLPIKPGHYLLTEFFVVDATNAVLLATPVEGSPMAYLVTDPLSIDIHVVKNGVNKLTPEVLAVGDKVPSSFGYTTFSFYETTTFDFPLAVMIYNETTENYELTSATVNIRDAGNHITYLADHEAMTTVVRLPDIYASYRVRIHKPGYHKFDQLFTLEQLKSYTEESEPLVVVLQPGSLVLWNRLGSDEEVFNSEVGPDLYFFTLGDDIHIPANHEYVAGVSGNAITIAPGTYYSSSRVHNVVLDNPATVLNPERGAIECYFYQQQSPVAFNHNPHRIVDGPYGFLSGMGFMSHDVYENGAENALSFYLALGGTPVSVSIEDFDQYNGQWLHLVAVWDRTGIDASDETMQLYINGVKMASATASTWGTVFGTKVDIAGGNDNNIARQFYVDELKFYDFAKTTF